MESQTRDKVGVAEPMPEQSRSVLAAFLRFAPPVLLAIVLAAGLMWHFVSGQRSSTAKTAATVAPTATATPNTQPLEMRAAWGNVTVHTVPTALPDNRVLIFDQAATPDGQWLVCSDVPREGWKTTRYSYLVLYNVGTGQMRTVARLAAPHSSVLAASMDQQWLVWTVGTGTMGGGDWGWAMYSYNLQTGSVVRLDIRLAPKCLPYTEAVVDQGRALWTEAVGPVTSTDGSNLRIRLADLATGAVQTVAQNASFPVFSWPWAIWTQYDSGTAHHAVARNLVTRQTVQFPDGVYIVAFSGTSAVAEDANAGTVHLYDDYTRDVSHLRLLGQAYPSFPTLNDRIVAWQGGPHRHVYDRVERRLVRLHAANGSSFSWVGKRALVWDVPESQAQQAKDPPNDIAAPTLDVIDTAPLPVLPA